MTTNIIQIGGSKGGVLPARILQMLNLSLKSAVDVTLDGKNIVISPQARLG